MVLKFNNSADYSNIPFFKRRFLETIGLILLIISSAIAVSLITFDINDPSFSYLTDNNVNNVFGKYGAYTSDILIKFFGAGSVRQFICGTKFRTLIFFLFLLKLIKSFFEDLLLTISISEFF